MHDVENKEEPKEVKMPPLDPIVVLLKNSLKLGYAPATPEDFTLHYSTRDIYDQLFKIYPNVTAFSMADVAMWMHDLGFRFMDFGGLQFEWLLKKVN